MDRQLAKMLHAALNEQLRTFAKNHGLSYAGRTTVTWTQESFKLSSIEFTVGADADMTAKPSEKDNYNRMRRNRRGMPEIESVIDWFGTPYRFVGATSHGSIIAFHLNEKRIYRIGKSQVDRKYPLY